MSALIPNLQNCEHIKMVTALSQVWGKIIMKLISETLKKPTNSSKECTI
jgi:hypothetical protein